jgi:hypothetical protein
VGRSLIAIAALALVAGACSSPDTYIDPPAAGKAAAASPIRSLATTSPTETVETVASSTTTTAARALDDFAVPTDALDSFAFELMMIDPADDNYGITAAGVFVSPDAVSCDVGNPAFISSSMGVGTGIGDAFWFDDGFSGAIEEPRSSESSQEWLEWCPGALEFWEQPVFLDERFASTFDGPGETIDGYETFVYSVESVSDDLIVDEGRVWLTDQGWPIQIEITGSIVGGVFALLIDLESGDDVELSTDMVPIHIVMAIGDVDESHIVRAPDGSQTVGPHGDITASVSTTVPASGELAAALDQAAESLCVTIDSPSEIIDGADLETLELSKVQSTLVDGNINQITPGMTNSLGLQVTTTSEAQVADLQTELLFNHRAPIAALSDWTGYVPAEWARDGELYFSLTSGTDEDAKVVSSWNGAEVTLQDGSTITRPYHFYLAVPEPELGLSPSAERGARRRLDDWIDAAATVVDASAPTGPQAMANLEALYQDLDATKRLACAVLGTAWTASDEAISNDAPAADRFDRIIEEVTVQETLLAIEYVNVLGTYLDQPRIDWLRADGLDLDTGYLSGDTTGTVLRFFTDLLSEAIFFSDPIAFG